MGAVSNSMCNGLEGLFLALVEIDPCEMAKGTITECILDHPFNSGSTEQYHHHHPPPTRTTV